MSHARTISSAPPCGLRRRMLRACKPLLALLLCAGGGLATAQAWPDFTARRARACGFVSRSVERC